MYAKQKHEKKLEKQKKIRARDAAEKRALELGEEVTIWRSFFRDFLKVFMNLRY